MLIQQVVRVMSLEPDLSSSFFSIRVNRADRAGLIFLTCDDIPEMFVTLLSESDIRPTLDQMLKTAFANEGQPEVYTNGKIDGPTINTVVRIAR